MKEYSLYVRQGSGKPYYLKPYSSLSEARKVLTEMIGLEEERQRPYYVDNDFFENKYTNLSNLKYICLKVRDVTDWIEYSETEEIKKRNNKILYLKNFKTS